MRPTCPRGRRRGVAILVVVVALALLSAMLGATTWQILAHRRTLDRHLNQAQAVWLARAGVERAAARLLADPPGTESESVALVPNSQVRVSVRREPGRDDSFKVTSEGRYPADGPNAVVRSVARRFRRVVEGGRTRLTVVTAGEAKQEAAP